MADSLNQQHDGFSRVAERTLLLVDDETNITASLKRLLRTDGYKIVTASSGQEGLDLLISHQVGVIITDQRMPEMTGVEFLRKVKLLYPETMRIVLSGYTELNSVTDAINEGAIYKFLTKPWDDEQLREQVKEAFQRYEMKQDNLRLVQEIEAANKALIALNLDLEQRVIAKTQKIQNNIKVLQVSQEVLEHLPIAVIGIDQDNMIVISNDLASRLFVGAETLLGCDVHQRLPPEVAVCMQLTFNDTHVVTLQDGQSLNVICTQMGEVCQSKGTVMVVFPLHHV